MRPQTKCSSVAGGQRGLISRDQAVELGMSADMIGEGVRSGRWERLLPRVYRIAGAPGSWHQQLEAVILWSGGRAVISHTSAAALWDLSGFSPGQVEATVVCTLKSPAEWVRIHRTALLSKSDVTKRHGLLVTRPTRTLVDLASVVPPVALEQALDDTLRRNLTSVAQLKWALRTWGHRRGSPALRSLVERRDDGRPPSESELETRAIRLIERAGFPPPIRQYPATSGGKFIGRVDLAYPNAWVAIEVDSRKFHSSPNEFARDRSRRNRLTRAGWRVLHLTHAEIKAGGREFLEALSVLLETKSGK